LLADDALRVDFYDRFGDFARNLAAAFSSEVFLNRTPAAQVDCYKADLKFFKTLRQSVRRRYAEVVDYSEYEPKIRKLLDTYLGAEQVDQITGPVDLFNEEARARAIEEAHGDAAKAHTIAYNTKRVLEERWRKEDPAFYRKFSRMLEDVIEAFRQQRLQATDFLKQASGIMNAVVTRSGDQTPDALSGNEAAKAYRGSIRDILLPFSVEGGNVNEVSTEAALQFDEIVERHRIVDWGTNSDIQNRIRQDFEDYLFELKARTGMTFGFDSIDSILDECIAVAKVRRP
jgi:type I restriction enzyme R subunit